MVAAFALGAYVVLSPVSERIAIVVCMSTIATLLLRNPSNWQLGFLFMPIKRRLGWRGAFKAHLPQQTRSRLTVGIGSNFACLILRRMLGTLFTYSFIFLLALLWTAMGVPWCNNYVHLYIEVFDVACNAVPACIFFHTSQWHSSSIIQESRRKSNGVRKSNYTVHRISSAWFNHPFASRFGSVYLYSCVSYCLLAHYVTSSMSPLCHALHWPGFLQLLSHCQAIIHSSMILNFWIYFIFWIASSVYDPFASLCSLQLGLWNNITFGYILTSLKFKFQNTMKLHET